MVAQYLRLRFGVRSKISQSRFLPPLAECRARVAEQRGRSSLAGRVKRHSKQSEATQSNVHSGSGVSKLTAPRARFV